MNIHYKKIIENGQAVTELIKTGEFNDLSRLGFPVDISTGRHVVDCREFFPPVRVKT